MGGFEELGGVDVPERVGGEVAEAPHGPVDVLKAAFGVGLGTEAEEFFERVIPSGGDVGHFQLVPARRARSSLKRRRMWRSYVASSASTRMERVGGAVDGGEEVIERDLSEDGGRAPGRGDTISPRRGRERPTWFSQRRDWDSWMPRETAWPEGRWKSEAGRPCS